MRYGTNGSYQNAEEVDAETMARSWGLGRPLLPGIARRSRARRRVASVVHRYDDTLRDRVRNHVTTMRKDETKRRGEERRSGVAGVEHTVRVLPAVAAESRGLVRAASWLSEGGAWGKRERGSRGSYSKKRRRKRGNESSAMNRDYSAVSRRRRGRDLGRAVAAGGMTGGAHLSASERARAGGDGPLVGWIASRAR